MQKDRKLRNDYSLKMAMFFETMHFLRENLCRSISKDPESTNFLFRHDLNQADGPKRVLVKYSHEAYELQDFEPILKWVRRTGLFEQLEFWPTNLSLLHMNQSLCAEIAGGVVFRPIYTTDKFEDWQKEDSIGRLGWDQQLIRTHVRMMCNLEEDLFVNFDDSAFSMS